jgi:hypothetical protein
VDGSVVYGDKPVGVKKPKDSEFVQKPFGAVVYKTYKVKNIITMKNTRTPMNIEIRGHVERHCLAPELQGLPNVLSENPTQARMSSRVGGADAREGL